MRTERILKIENTVFTFAVAFLLFGALWTALSWPLRASIIVLVLGSIGIVLALAQFAADVSRSAPRLTLTMEAPAAKASGRWGHTEVWAWILGLYLGIHLLGFPLAVPLFVFANTKTYGAGWFLSLSLTTLAWAFIYGVFESILHVPWPTPLLWYLI